MIDPSPEGVAGARARGFKRIDIEDKPIISSYLALYPDNEGSECIFSNLYIWGRAEHIEWRAEGDCLMLHVRERGLRPCMLMAFAPPDRIGAALRMAEDEMRARGEDFQMRSLPAWYVELMLAAAPDRYRIEREPHHDDYLYKARDLIDLSGKALHAKRNHINRFRAEYEGRFRYEPLTPAIAGECAEVQRDWRLAQPNADDPAWIEEEQSVLRALSGFEALGLIGGAIRIDGRLAAFTIGERINDRLALIHVEKALADYKGLYAMINREFAARELSDALYVNREEDMGIEGLRRAKRSYAPARMVEKFGATRR